MPNQRLQHDAAASIATACLDVIEPVLHPALYKQAWESFYTVAKDRIEAYEIAVERNQHRLRPTKN
jgi:hypothetical protein